MSSAWVMRVALAFNALLVGIGFHNEVSWIIGGSTVAFLILGSELIADNERCTERLKISMSQTERSSTLAEQWRARAESLERKLQEKS